ncbi:TetR/AcrR family transcriptional regulator [Microlunatus soli]|uniref:DNA-binding transcriptional regulator, AcrR family n=1 Tax=Microlunatus soli TaxID=630515 RepID=A0A1H1URY8_9ACTN|nr:TetR family transcriptional regulator C-terminal domain-containing protein [Microlunatus soli]SDS74866.1 DNA-binding transcriptional regulator, AcrR family [Microlunatus soli]
MVNTIDGAQRRHLLAEAVWRLILRGGLAAATVRGVADEAGLSAGSVRHFFTSQADLHIFAMTELIDTVSARVATAAEEPDLERRVRAMLEELLPLTDRSRSEFSAYLEFVIRSRTDERLRPVTERSVLAVRELLSTVLDGMQQLGLIAPELAITAETVRLQGLLDGLTLRLVIAPDTLTVAQARRSVDDHLQALRPAQSRKQQPTTKASS